MQTIIVNTAEDFDQKVADLIVAQIAAKPDTTLGIATGDTTIALFRLLSERNQAGLADFTHVKTINLDEYVGVDPTMYCSCRFRAFEELLGKINIDPKNVYVPDGRMEPIEREIEVFHDIIERFGGVDLQIVSVGTNGHIAFNEPGTPFESDIRIADISQSTANAKAYMFGGLDKVPAKGITMGIKTIMHCKRILLIAKGENKAGIMRKILMGPVIDSVPASVLQLHPFVTVVMDLAAASDISRDSSKGGVAFV